MRCLDFLCAFLDFFVYPRINFYPRANQKRQKDNTKIKNAGPSA